MSKLVQDVRISDLRVSRQHQYLAQDLGRLWVVVSERQEDAAAVLSVHGDDTDHAAGHAMHYAAAHVYRVVAVVSLDQRIAAFELDVLLFQQGQRFLSYRCA
jgi:hypothetical protein